MSNPKGDTIKKRRVSVGHIKDLVADPENRRKHTPRNVGMIVDAMHKVGAGRSIVVDEDNQVLAGNATVEAAAEAGITKLRVIETDGNEVVAVRRTGLSEDQKRDLAIYDNRTGELAEWDMGQIMADIDNGVDLSAFFYDDELTAMLEVPEFDIKEPERTGEDFGAFLDFKCGDIMGRISKSVYDSFVKAYTAEQAKSKEVVMDDVLIAWLGL